MFQLFLLSLLSVSVYGKIYFKEDFNDGGWEKRWTPSSTWKDAAEMGEWKQTAGKWHGADASDMGLQTSEDARFYGLSAKLDEAFSNKDKQMVLQMSVKHEQEIDCGGAYIKLMGDIDQAAFGGDTPYQVMFGPDICGPSNRKTHVIFNYPPKDENLLISPQVKVETDRVSHLYSLVVNPDNTFEVFIDLESVKTGNLADSFEFLKPKEIKDPEQSKPADWVDTPTMADPDDVKPEGYDDIPEQVPDPEASKPEDWDDEEDGEYEPPMIDNPEYKGPWQPKQIPHPDYKGVWKHPMIPNPEFEDDKELHYRCKDCTHIGFELWQVKAGTIFDDIIVTDSWDEAQEYAAKTFTVKKGPEKEMFDEAKAAEDAAKAEAAAAAAAAAEEAEDEEEDDEDSHDEL
jgi:calreticulin